MDPVTAIGLVSGILSFVGAAGKVLKLSWTLYNSLEGSSEETETRTKLADSMAVMSKRILPPSQPALTEEDGSLVDLAQQCGKLANDIKDELAAIKPKRRKSKTQSTLAAVKTILIEPTIKGLEKKLQECRDQLHFNITAMSSENLRALLEAAKENGAKLTQLEVSISQLRGALQDTTITKASSLSDAALKQLEDLLHVGQDALNDVAQDRILRGIKGGFKDMSYRYQHVDSTFGGTFEWIFDLDGKSPEATKFTQWLSSGKGVFHICGKLGAGKSTLMKKLFTHKRARTELEKWADANGGRKLIMANFFFYALGSDPRQKSLMGLYRTLLYQILETSPGLMQNLFPDQWTKALSQPKIRSEYEILDDDIKQAYQRLSKEHDGNALGGYCFSFFIDGLDEYQTTTSVDRREMVRSLTDLADNHSGIFKLCVSSRIENPFMDMFSNDTRLYLHELTKPDMEEYVEGTLQHVGTLNQRLQLASSITKKAEGVFLWVVLVVQNIRKRSDDGAKFSRLLREVESLPTELNDLFHRILDSLGAEDRRLVSHTVSVLLLLDAIPEAKKMYLWLNLSDFYFLEDYEAEPHFAKSTQFPNQESETVEEIEIRARRQLRGVCRGLVDADEAKDIDFIHRSVGDFFKQDKVRAEMHDEHFNSLEALSQLKLASIKQYWWDVERNGTKWKDHARKEAEEEIVSRHSIIAACLVGRRRRQQLDEPPFGFLESLDTIPSFSVGKSIGRALARRKTAFRVNLDYNSGVDLGPYTDYEICHTSRVRHTWIGDHSSFASSPDGPAEEDPSAENSEVPWRDADEEVDIIDEFTTAVISPLLTELCSGRLEYPLWRLDHIKDRPLEPENLAMLVYCAIGTGIGRNFWERSATTTSDELDINDLSDLRGIGLFYLRHLFERQIVSPNQVTRLAFGDEFAFIRIAARDQQLTIWQHFLCWWLIVAAASGDFEPESEPEGDADSGDKPKGISAYSWTQSAANWVLHTFIEHDANLHLALKIGGGRDTRKTGADDLWVEFSVEMVPEGGEAVNLDVVVNLQTRMELTGYPYGPPKDRYWRNWEWERSDYWVPFPDSPLSVRDWVACSRLPNKHLLLQLIDEKLGVTAAEVDDVQMQDGP